MKLSAYVELIVECKNNQNPFVFIARPKNRGDRAKSPEEFVFPYQYQTRREHENGRVSYRDCSAFHHLGYDKVFKTYVNSWKAAQFYRIDSKGNTWNANHGGLYDAIFYPVAKALVARRAEIPKPTHPKDWRYFWLFFPLVVTSGELYMVDSGVNPPHPVPVNYVSFERELKSGKLSGSFVVTFVRQEAHETFLKEVIDPLVTFTQDLVAQRYDHLKTTIVPWVE